jgi:lactate permease
MGDVLLFGLALLPFILIFYLMIIKKMSAFLTMPIVFIVSLIMGVFIWKIPLLLISAASLKGIFMALEIILIVFGALFLLNIFNKSGKIEGIKYFLARISDDARIQAVLIAWFFVSFVEGVAGFGTPAALAAPLLVSLGFSAFGAVVLSLIGDSTAVSFGAAGTPILLGLPKEALNLSDEILKEITINAALFHLIIGTMIPLVMVFLVVFYIYEKKQKVSKFVEIIPFAIFSGLAFTVPYFLTARFIGAEMPSILGSLIGFIIVGFAARKGFLVPRNKLIFKHNKIKAKRKRDILFAFSPYIILIFGLLVSRIIFPIKNFLNNIFFGWTNILGYNIIYTFRPFFTPSFYFMIAGIFAILVFKLSGKKVKESFIGSIERLERPLVALIFTLAFVQILVNSGDNFSGLESIPLILAGFIADFTGKFYVILAPMIGTLGAFITGSNTVSNLLLAEIQSQTAISIGVSIVLILALQVVGGAIGNMFAIHNVLAAEATVKLHGKEGEIMRKTAVVALGYALLVGIIGFLIFVL